MGIYYTIVSNLHVFEIFHNYKCVSFYFKLGNLIKVIQEISNKVGFIPNLPDFNVRSLNLYTHPSQGI